MPGAAKEDLLPAAVTQEFDPEVIGRARRRDAGEVTLKLVDAERRMALICIEQAQRLGEALLISPAKRHQ
jgi:hypothetical protein